MRSGSEKPFGRRISREAPAELATYLIVSRQRLDRFRPPGLRGTFAPFFRASDRPIAIACFRLFTVLPLLPDLSVPFFLRRIALSTRFEAALPYFRRLEGFRVAITVLRFGVFRMRLRTDWRVLCQRINASIELLPVYLKSH
jgi:hypothetical protein